MKKNKIIGSFKTGHPRSVQIKKHIFYSFLSKGISIIIGLAYVPLLIDFLDSERYGIWLTISSILMWFSFFDIGLGNGLRNMLTISIANGDNELSKKYISTTYALLVIIFSAVLVLFFIVNNYLPWEKILNTNIISRKELQLLFYIVFTFFILRFIFEIIGKIYFAFQRPSMSSLFGPLGRVISIVIIYILTKLNSEGNLIILGFILSVAPFVVLLGFTFYSFKYEYNNLVPSFKYIDLSLRKDLLGLGFQFFLLQVASVMMFSASNIIITQIFSPEEVTRYNVAFQYFQVPIMLYTIINTPIWSSVTDAYAKEEVRWLKNTLKTMNQFSLLFIGGIILMVIFSSFVFKMWIGDRITIPKSLVYSMAVFAIIKVITRPYSAYINGIGKLKLANFIVNFSLVLLIPTGIIFAKVMDSSSGVVIANCLLNSVSLIVFPIQISKLLNKKAYGIWNK